MLFVSSPFTVGGDFLSGRYRGLEEEVCMRSSLYLSLQEAARLAYAEDVSDMGGFSVHIPEDGLILSTNVQVFRENASKNYTMFDSPVELAGVMSISLPNLGSHFASSDKALWGPPLPDSIRPDRVAYDSKIRQKFET